jgi:hypothetical protein
MAASKVSFFIGGGGLRGLADYNNAMVSIIPVGVWDGMTLSSYDANMTVR